MSNKLNVLFLCSWYPSRVLPTNGDFVQRHAEAVSLKQKVTVIHIITDKESKKNIDFTSEIINGIETRIAYIKYSSNPIKKIFLFIKSFIVLLQKSDSFDIVHLNEIFPFGIFSLYLKWFKKTPFIITEHWTDYKYPLSNKISFSEKILSKLIVKNASFVCPVTKYLEQSMVQFGLKGNYTTIPNVVDTELFIPKKKETIFLKLVHISSLRDEHKNIKGMLRVAKLLSERLKYFEWDFIGNNGDGYKKYLKELDIKNSKISFLKHTNHSEIVSNLQKASICISFSNYESFGIVITEAIACGTPVISTNTGIVTNLKELNSCKIIPIKNEQLLFESILNYKTIFADLDIYKMHSYIDSSFSKEIICNKFTNLYYKTLSK